MFTQTIRNTMPTTLEDEFNKPVESIMRCEDFKSNFARRLSNRFTPRASILHSKQNTGLNLSSPINGDAENVSKNAPERIESNIQLSNNTDIEQNGEAVKPPDKPPLINADMKRTQATALNMEVETLRWQLAQTEANRQMHIALLKQIVAFLNKVKEHIAVQNNETNLQKNPTRLLPRSFNMADLPRSRSVVHVNKNFDYSLTTAKKISTRKISKSISNVNGFKDYNSGMWSQSKMPLEPEKETSQKISEEISRLITLANTVLSTNIPDLASNDTESNLLKQSNLNIIDKFSIKSNHSSNTTLSQIEEDSMMIFKDRTDSSVVTKENVCNNHKFSHVLQKDFLEIKITPPQNIVREDGADTVSVNSKILHETRNDFNSNFIEDESGFSSMSSFQDIGIPIISVIPPSPCKEIEFIEEIPDIIDDVEKWKTDNIELEKQSMKVFWV